jgi:hypothetical protein
MNPEDQVVLDNDFDKQVFEFGLKVGKTFLKYNTDLKPTISFYFDKKDPNKQVMMFPKNEDCSMFLASLDVQLHEKFVLPGASQFNNKIYLMIFRELGLLKNREDIK